MMSNTDASEWRLIDSDLVTVLGILPASESHLYLVLNEPGSGELKIPLGSALADSVASGQFAQATYRGAVRGGFFVENISKGQADASEGGGQWVSISGRGALSLLEDAIIWSGGTTESTREFAGMTKAAILIALIDEAQVRGALANLSYDFTAVLDSDGVAWTDSETYKLNVGSSLLDLVRQFARTGIDFDIVPGTGAFVLSAYKTGMGSDKSETVYFRTGVNCEEVTSDEQGDKIKNAQLIAYKGGFISVSDVVSIAARRRREKLLDLKMAQTPESATTIGAAEVELSKDPKKSISVKIYDGAGPRGFVDYELGDYIMLDVQGTETRYRIYGIQPDWKGDQFSTVIVELNSILYENDIQLAQDVAWLMDQWSTANDAGLLAVRYWAGFGSPNDRVSCMFVDGIYLYVGGQFTIIGGIVANRIARYNTTTGEWTALGAGLSGTYVGGTAECTAITVMGSSLYAGGTFADAGGVTVRGIAKWNGSTWSKVGTGPYGGFNNTVTCLANDGVNLYAGGNFTTFYIAADPFQTDCDYIAKFTGTTWVVMDAGLQSRPKAMDFDGAGNLWVGAGISGFPVYPTVEMWNGSTWSSPADLPDNEVYAVKAIGTDVYFGGVFQNVGSLPTACIAKWDGLSWAALDSGLSGALGTSRVFGLASYLTDLYVVGDFTNVGNNIARWSGGSWSALAGGLSVNVYCVAVGESGQVYAGGMFATADGKTAPKLAAYFTTFETALEHLENEAGSFNLGGAIHAATASAITDNDEIPFWEDVSNALRKITWANIKATLKTYFDTLYVAWTVLTDSKDPTGWLDPSAITVSYDSAARTITLTGTLVYYWRGVKTTLTSPWTSSAHTATNGGWFLSSTDGTNFTWSTTVWTFDALMVAFVNYGTTYKFAMREVHGLMQWQTHEELHSTIGTYKESGGTLSGYTLASTTAANRRPDVAATILHDEDNETTNAALTSKLYNKLYLAGAGATITYTGETADIVPLLVNNPYFNKWDGAAWIQTLMANNSYMSVWLVAIPTAADTTSQTYRYTWVQGQSNTNLAGQTALTPSDLNLAAFSTEATEFVFLAKIIIRYTGGNWDLNSITVLTGNRLIQVGSPAGAYLSSVATDATLTGDGSLTNPLSVVGGGGGVSPVSPSVVGNIVSFADTTGGQTDSGVPAAQVLTGTGWPFNFWRLLYTDAVGNVTDDDRLIYDPTSGIFSFGMNDGSNNSNMRFGGNTGNVATPNTTPSFLRLINYGVTSTSTNLFKGTSARGTKTTPTASLIDDLLAHFNGAGYSGTGNVEDATSTGGMSVVANENQSATNRGTRLDFYSTPNSATAKVKAFTVNADGTVNIQSGKTYNVNGSPHTHAHNDATSLQGGTAGEYYHLTSEDNTEAVAFLNGGTNSHTAVDAHIASTANPHSTTAAQIGIVAETNTNNIYNTGAQTANSVFSALINGTPTNVANSVVTFDTVSAGNVGVITPAAAGQLAQMRLYNTTRGNYALIVSATGATVMMDRNVRTLASPWADNDVITITSPTSGICDLEIVSGITGKSSLFIYVAIASATVGNLTYLHPFSADAVSKRQVLTELVANQTVTSTFLLSITSNVFSFWWTGNVTAVILRETGYIT